MNELFNKKKETIALLKQKNSIYAEILAFYEMIMEEQESLKPELPVQPLGLNADFKTLQIKEGFPLLDKKDFVIDINTSKELFESICRIGKTANEKLKDTVHAIEEAIMINALNSGELLRRFYDEHFLERISTEFDIDRPILNFLIYTSIQPSIILNVEKLKDRIDLQNWLRGYCPVCGSSPLISELKGEGQRFYVCSFCTFEWPSERLKCPFCENRDQKRLHYFFAEGQEAYRVDVCDNCNQYIKTVDSRKLGYEPYLDLEDIVTVHLDLIASEKGFKRPAPSLWGI